MKRAVLIAVAIVNTALAACAQTEIISATDAWDYLSPTDGVDPATLDPNSDFSTTWHSFTNYDGPAFTANKPGPFFYGAIDYFTTNNLAASATGIGTGPAGTTAPPSGTRYTAYFKKQITVPENFPDSFLRILADDGVVVYLDGEERIRVNMTGTNPNAANNSWGDTYMMGADTFADETVTADVPMGALPAGSHVIALALHNQIPTSSDLGLYVQLFVSTVPPSPSPGMLRTEFGGVFTEITANAPLATAGWQQDDPPLSFALIEGGASTLKSVPINLSAVGQVYFTAQLFIYERSTDTNFEPDDTFGAKLIITRDDNSVGEVNLVPTDLDGNLDGLLAGNELDPQLVPAADVAFFGRQLRAAIPADVKSLQVLVLGNNDSPNEEFDIGGMLISDIPPGSDADGDGMDREVEMFAQTDPSDPLSVFQIKSVERALNAASGEYEYTLTHPGVVDMWYTVEYSRNGSDWTLFGFTQPSQTDPDRQVVASFTATEDPGPGLMLRMRAVP